ncbi:MAG TPA: ABC transporter ATP-binding protein, partial [Solirubrobacteraceae bacterium]|nr:ABC transporter ATP-binding protein [Solirubrobacteraceae bacterium]
MSLVEVDNLTIRLTGSGTDIVSSVSFGIDAGETLALVGESGSGKTTIAVALLGDARRGAELASGTVRIGDTTIVPGTPSSLRAARGRLVAYVPQDPAAALNPARRIGVQIAEPLIAHGIGASGQEREERVRAVLDEVKLPRDCAFLARFPHQLSGGQQQRVCIAIAAICEPKVLVLDEPTTGLDVSTQAHILQTLGELVAGRGLAVLYVTHDLAVVANIAQRIMVLYAGRVAEYGQAGSVFRAPAHPYTRGLLGAVPDIARRHVLEVIPGLAPAPNQRPAGCAFAPRCALALPACRDGVPALVAVPSGQTAACVRAGESVHARTSAAKLPEPVAADTRSKVLEVSELGAWYGSHQVLHDISFELLQGECLALVGESGSGKTTLARSIVGLVAARTGEVRLEGESLPVSTRAYPERAKRTLQYIFQSPYNSLNPRRSVGAAIGTPIQHFFGLSRRAAEVKVREALERVALPVRVAGLYPDQLSGGERQRVAIARAVAKRPLILLADEPTGNLDSKAGGEVIDLLHGLADDGATLVLITH